MDIHNRYRKMLMGKNKTVKERERNGLKWHFENVILKTLPTAYELQISAPEEYTITENTPYHEVILEDITNNDKKALDEKNLYTKVDANIDIGCYLYYDDAFWIITFQEHKTIQDKKHFVIRKCNQFINYKYNNILYKIPVSIENLTMYSDGVYDGVYVTTEDAKRQIWMGNNPVTRTLNAGTRIMLPHNSCFKVTHINDFEYCGSKTGSHGLLKALVLQTAIIKEDDLENDIAYNNDDRHNIDLVKDSIRDASYPDLNYDKIIGSDTITLGAYEEYHCDTDLKWKITGDTDYFKLMDVTDNSCKIVSAFTIEGVGKEIELIGTNVNESIELRKRIVITT